MEELLILKANDNVALATTDLAAGQTSSIANQDVEIRQETPLGSKVALKDLPVDTVIVKNGSSIGKLTTAVVAGELVDEHKLAEVTDGTTEVTNRNAKEAIPLTFMGYRRANGTVGIRNDLYIVPTVGCITPLMDVMVQEFKAKHPDNGSFDNIILLKHPYGCSQLGDDFEQTRQILCDAIMHPNAGGVLVFGLGCENNQMDGMKEELTRMGGIDPQRMKFLVAQEVKDEFADAQRMLEELNQAAAGDHREPVPLSALKIGIQDVRSDRYSTLTANRLLGTLTESLTENDGTVAITSYPKLSAAKQELLARSVDGQVSKQVEESFADYAQYTTQFDQSLTPALTEADTKQFVATTKERATNSLQMIGEAQIAAAVPYGERLEKNGVNLVMAPDNDLIDSSALASAGCQLVLVSTGLGTPYATYVPTIKVASNAKLAQKKAHWVDFDGSKALTADFEAVKQELMDQVLAVANGQKTKNEQSGLHGLAIFKMGVTE